MNLLRVMFVENIFADNQNTATLVALTLTNSLGFNDDRL